MVICRDGRVCEEKEICFWKNVIKLRFVTDGGWHCIGHCDVFAMWHVRQMDSVVCGDPGTDILMFATHFISKHRAFHYPIKFFWYLKDFLQTQLMMTQAQRDSMNGRHERNPTFPWKFHSVVLLRRPIMWQEIEQCEQTPLPVACVWCHGSHYPTEPGEM